MNIHEQNILRTSQRWEKLSEIKHNKKTSSHDIYLKTLEATTTKIVRVDKNPRRQKNWVTKPHVSNCERKMSKYSSKNVLITQQV